MSKKVEEEKGEQAEDASQVSRVPKDLVEQRRQIARLKGKNELLKKFVDKMLSELIQVTIFPPQPASDAGYKKAVKTEKAEEGDRE